MAGWSRKALVPVLVLIAAALLWGIGRFDSEVEPSLAGPTLPTAALPPLQPGQVVTFVELGSEGCKPCEAMKPVMESVRQRFPGQVEVVFHDVRKDPAMAGKYRIMLIPTQVFLLPDGKEFFRHEGFFPLEEVEKVLAGMGLPAASGKPD